jgi:hypothetical protein
LNFKLKKGKEAILSGSNVMKNLDLSWSSARNYDLCKLINVRMYFDFGRHLKSDDSSHLDGRNSESVQVTLQQFFYRFTTHKNLQF